MSRRSGTASRRRAPRVVAALVALGALALAVSVPASPTEAAWADREHAQGSVTAARLAPPQVVAQPSVCNIPLLGALGAPILTFSWRFPATTGPYAGLTAANVAWQVDTVATTSVTTTGPDANGVYTSSFTRSIIQGIIGTVLSGFTVTLRTSVGYGATTWTSPGSTTVTSTNILIVGQSCSYANGT